MRPFIYRRVARILRETSRRICTHDLGTSHDATKYTPRRALMYVPASDEHKLSKIPGLSADCIVLDAEDGVAITAKDVARTNAVQFFRDRSYQNSSGPELGFRTNSVQSGMVADDLKVFDSVDALPDAFMLPKVDSIAILQEFCSILKQLICSTYEVGGYDAQRIIPLVIWIESARAVLDIDSILAAATQLHTHSPLRAEAVVFGSDDFCADIGATRSPMSSESLYARQRTVLAAKAHRLQAIDAVYIDFKDTVGLNAQAEEGAKWGFTGKQVIHPSQISIVQRAFTPCAEKIQWAKDLVAAFEAQSADGTGAITFQGQMIDMPLYLQAQNILAIVDATSKAVKLGNHQSDGNSTTTDADSGYLKDSEGKINLKFIISNSAAGALLGRNGHIINKIRGNHDSVHIRIPQSISADRNLVLTGDNNLEILDALSEIMDQMDPINQERHGKYNSELRLVVDNNAAGAILGVGGSVVQELCRKTKTGVKVLPYNDDRLIKIKGDKSDVLVCLTDILLILENPY